MAPALVSTTTGTSGGGFAVAPSGVIDGPPPPVSDFIQQLPDNGEAATEKTEAWIFYDAQNVYVSARIWDSAPESQWIANEMQRDSFQLINNDSFSLAFDTFYDRRNGVAFLVNPIGGFVDYEITDEGNPNIDWNPIWDVRTGRFEGGWTVEMEIPFKSLPFPPATTQTWGFQLGRIVRRKSESTFLTPVSISAGQGMFRLSAAGTLTGIEVPGDNRTFEIKPYAIGSLATDINAVPLVSNEGDGDFGVDVKYGVTQSLTADFTYNTDFALVEVDEQQVNLTRFSLFFPEKREFFLEAGSSSAGPSRPSAIPAVGSRSHFRCRLNRASPSTPSSYRQARSRPSWQRPVSPTLHACSLAVCCSTTPPGTCSAAMSVCAGSINRGASSSSSTTTSVTRSWAVASRCSRTAPSSSSSRVCSGSESPVSAERSNPCSAWSRSIRSSASP